ncbi:MAG: hypothetical protein U0R44_05675 [Candidatus Micrarchaeia archaeon]
MLSEAVLVLMLVAMLSFHASFGGSDPSPQQSSKDMLADSHLTVTKETTVQPDEDASKKSRGAPTRAARFPGAPAGLHILPMFAMFFFILLMVFEKEARARETLLLPVIFSFLIYKVLFLMEENEAMDRFMRKIR